jgi:hypothetical protein
VTNLVQRHNLELQMHTEGEGMSDRHPEGEGEGT